MTQKGEAKMLKQRQYLPRSHLVLNLLASKDKHNYADEASDRSQSKKIGGYLDISLVAVDSQLNER